MEHEKKTQIGMVVFIYHLYLRNLGPWHILNWVGAKDGGLFLENFRGCLISEFYCKPQEPQTCTQFYYTTTHYGEDILAATPANGGRNEPAFYGPFPF